MVCYYLTLTLTFIKPASSAVTLVDDGDAIEGDDDDDDDDSSDDGGGVIVITVLSAAGSVAAVAMVLSRRVVRFCSVQFSSVQYYGTVALWKMVCVIDY